MIFMYAELVCKSVCVCVCVCVVESTHMTLQTYSLTFLWSLCLWRQPSNALYAFETLTSLYPKHPLLSVGNGFRF